LVLVCKEAVQAFSDVSPAAFADLQVAVAGIERVLGKVAVDYEKINYLMLMMVDKDVHFHVHAPLRRRARVHDGRLFRRRLARRAGLGATVELSSQAAERLAERLAQAGS
jgi:diadenosine tetraphosphate (Ap4A) HIT family hydrolase